MKQKVISTILILVQIVLIFSSCASKPREIPQEIIEMQKSFNCVADINYKGIKAVATISKAAPGLCSINFTEPSILKGMVVDFQGGKIVIKYLGLELDLSNQNSAAKAIATTIIQALESASTDKSIDVEFKDGVIIARGTTPSGKYEVTLDELTGFLLSLKSPEQDISVDFKDFRFVNPAQTK